mmetsp:Transcript_41546/g.121461  ORF Transcript_41546/g.121461 Transcript_41546/m.121461 type:complete len:228 (+) Transcript_41546:761-1444(+)
MSHVMILKTPELLTHSSTPGPRILATRLHDNRQHQFHTLAQSSVVKLSLAVIVCTESALARHLLSVIFGHKHEHERRLVNAGRHLCDHVAAHPILVEPGDKARRFQRLIHLGHAHMVVASLLILPPIVRQEHVVYGRVVGRRTTAKVGSIEDVILIVQHDHAEPHHVEQHHRQSLPAVENKAEISPPRALDHQSHKQHAKNSRHSDEQVSETSHSPESPIHWSSLCG